MGTASTTAEVIEVAAVIDLTPTVPVSRETLEALTIEVEHAFDQQALGITQGASASANFETGNIEIDVILTGQTMGDLSRKVALVVAQLEQGWAALTVQASQMRRLHR